MNRRIKSRLLPLTAIAALGATGLPARATNGMDMEGYGPVSTAMGGAAQAMDHGTAAMAQNPATLALMGGNARLDLAIGGLGPSVTSSVPGGPSAKSSGTSYLMPALGYARRSGALTWGLGLFAQGGMGTDYSGDSFLAAGSGAPVRSQLGVGRVMLPLAWQATPDLALGASIDFMWASLDMRMAASGAQLGGLVTAASGNLGAALPALGGAPWARIDFSTSNKYFGAASATGWAAKLGLVYRVAPAVTLGASYQSKSALADMKTSGRGASLSAAGGFADSGRITVVNFQWPATWAAGAAWQATPALLLAADVKRIEWSTVMQNFRLRYDSAGLGGSVSFALPQNWSDQTVLNVGAAWAVNPALTLRAGYNYGKDPIPAAYVNPLFPATVQSHYTLGLGYAFDAADSFDGSLTLAPTSSVTTGSGVVVTHRQTNFQLMYSHRY
ncbi:MAG: outer membrane protein transport protein [Burkholderiales bacterium]|nr:outer membrane protein transport protein [Burkholderiales bacterium]MDE1927285.1 outer membrane protein transport protein [Burkholderiales bacterium]MDE2157326.1 outer membrane protein transport protein [Burkholderiales bacterium]MDE2502028.1 outer membrane protein transport protein [Burkholderiales bacterium]